MPVGRPDFEFQGGLMAKKRPATRSEARRKLAVAWRPSSRERSKARLAGFDLIPVVVATAVLFFLLGFFVAALTR